MGEQRLKVVVAAAVCALAVAVGVGAGLAGRPGAPGPPPQTVGPRADPGTIEVHVSGWVVSPGVVSVPEGSITATAIEAAGGLRSGAETASLNLAATLSAGEQVVVPGPGSMAVGESGSAAGPISLSQAGAAELEELPGVGPVIAERIVSYRESHGPFESVEDLLDVPGVGEAKLAAIRDLVRP